jgi:hypothetical protein
MFGGTMPDRGAGHCKSMSGMIVGLTTSPTKSRPKTSAIARAIVTMKMKAERHARMTERAFLAGLRACNSTDGCRFKRTIRRLKAGIDKLEESNIILRRLNHDA